MRKFSELGDSVALAARGNHFYINRPATSRIIRHDTAEDHHATVGAGGLSTAAQDRRRFSIRPIVQHRLEQIKAANTRAGAAS
jgi:hypothetical protein